MLVCSVVRWLNANLDLIGGKSGKPLERCAELFKKVISVTMEETALHAFEQMVKHNIGGVAVVGADG